MPFWPRNPGFVRKQDPGPGSGSGVGINIFPRANKTICWGENTYGNVHVPWHLRFRYDRLIMCSFFKITVSEGTKYDNAYISVADRDPVSFWPRDSGSGMGKKSGSGSGINCRIIFPTNTNHCFGLKYLNFWMRIWDPGWKHFGSGRGKSRIRYPRSTSRIRNTDLHTLNLVKIFDTVPYLNMKSQKTVFLVVGFRGIFLYRPKPCRKYSME